MQACPKCGAWVMPGASDCPKCGQIFTPDRRPIDKDQIAASKETEMMEQSSSQGAFAGRMPSGAFLRTFVLLLVGAFIAVQLDFRLQTGRWRIGPSPALLFYWTLFAYCIYVPACIRRAHDRNKSGWWAILYAVPQIGWLWAFIELGFMKGTAGPNRFGADPLAPPSPAATPDIATVSVVDPSLKGTCPACQAVIPMHAKECPQCKAILDAPGGWRPTLHSALPSSPTRTQSALSASNVLLEANQFLRYKAANKSKMEAQIKFTEALLARKDAPAIRLVILRSVDPNADYKWLLLKASTLQSIHSYAGTDTFSDDTFGRVFPDQPRSITWADHIAENCPRPGESLTQHGIQVYEALAHDIKAEKFLIEAVVRQ